MTFIAEGRLSDSPYVDSIWRGQADDNHTMMCPADGRFNICLSKLNGKVRVFVEGPMTRAVPKTHVEGVDWLVIKLNLGVFLPGFSARKVLDGDVTLPNGAGEAFWLHGAVWEIPNFENVDTFVDWLARDEVLMFNPVVQAALEGQPQDKTVRTVRHHFQQTIGMTQSHVRQIEVARDAMTLLQKRVPILDVVQEMGYADQPHLTRSLKRFMGYTPAQIAIFKPPL